MTEDFSQACEHALQRFMREFGIDDRDKALRHIAKDWLVSHGYVGTNDKADDGNGDGRNEEFVQYPSYFKGKGSI